MQETKDQLDVAYVFNKIKVQTPFGLKLKQNLKVFKADDSSALISHFEVLDNLKNKIEHHPVTFKKIREIMSHFKAIDLTLERIYGMETLSVTELFEVKNFVILINQLIEQFEGSQITIDQADLIPLKDILSLLDPEAIGINSFYIYDGYSDKLRLIRERIRLLEKEIQDEKKDKRTFLSNEFSIKIRPNDELMVAKHEEELIQSLNQHSDFIYVSDTMMHRNYRINDSDVVKSHHNEVDRLKAEELDEEYEIRSLLTNKLNEHLDDIRHDIKEVATLDLMMAKAYFAIAFKMTKPVIGKGLVIKDGIHLKVQEHLNGENLEFTPISIDLSKGMTCITGANMGGKTICLRLIGQMQMMAQYGLFVPCQHFEFELQNFIFLSSQDAQSIDKGLSTFGAEMVNVSDVLRKADDKGLILIDELARGTNPKEGYAISKAIINYLKSKSSISVITTHFDGLADEEDVLHLQVRGLSHVDFEDLKINIDNNTLEVIHDLMDYRLRVIEGPEAVPKDAISISKMMGVDEKILEDAKRILVNREH